MPKPPKSCVVLRRICQIFSRSIWERRRSHHPAVKRLSRFSLGPRVRKTWHSVQKGGVGGCEVRGEFFGTHSRGKGGRLTGSLGCQRKELETPSLPWPCLKVGSRLYHTKHLALPLRLATEQGDCSRQDGRIIMKGQNSILWRHYFPKMPYQFSHTI